MKETKVLGALIPSIPEYQPIIQSLRDKYNLPEISIDEEPIKEIYLDDKLITLEDFHQDVLDLVQKNSDFLISDSKVEKFYKQGKQFLGQPLILKGYEKLLPKKTKQAMNDIYNLTQNMMKLVVEMIDAQFKKVAEIICIYLLTGEAEEVPQDWFSQVGIVNIEGNPHVFVLASQIADPEMIVQQFRQQYTKTFGIHRPKVTDTMVTTAYYLRLKKMGKPMSYIVEEFIRINKISLPRDKTSKRYVDVIRKCEQKLKKRMQRSQSILEVIGRDIK